MVLEFIFYSLCVLHLIVLLQEVLPLLQARISSSFSSTLPVSIIIAAHQEEANLKKLIPWLLNIADEHIEIIVSLDRCSDGSYPFLQQLNDDRIAIISIDKTPDGWDSKKYALSSAIEKSTHDHLMLIDADCIPASAEWINLYRRAFENNTNLVLGIGGYTNHSDILSQLNAYETLSTAIRYTSSALTGKPFMGVGRNIGYRKSIFKACNGFEDIQNITGGDDDLLVQKMAPYGKSQVLLGPNTLTYSSPKRTWKGYVSQKIRHLSVGKFYQSKFRIILSLKAIIHALLWLSFIYLTLTSNSPQITLGVFGGLMLVKGLFYNKVARKIGLSFTLRYPFYDLLLALFLPLIGLRASLIKITRWN